MHESTPDEAAIKFNSLLDLMKQIFPLQPINLLKHMMNKSVFNE